MQVPTKTHPMRYRLIIIGVAATTITLGIYTWRDLPTYIIPAGTDEEMTDGVEGQLNSLASEITMYHLHYGALPETLLQLNRLDDEARSGRFDHRFRDIWGNAIGYRVESTSRAVVWSLGDDGEVGGVGLSRDIERIVDLGH